jgi:indole-3-glycerol phosphate synthase
VVAFAHVGAPGILGKILDEKRREVAAARERAPERALVDRADAAPAPRDLAAALRRGGRPSPRVIAEFKRASPSAGPIRPGADPGEIAAEYERSGAAAVSVLTDRTFFDGDLAHVTAARARVAVPILRKDFVIDPWQVLEARAAGADAVLLIVAALDDATLASLIDAVHARGMTALVEIHDRDEARRAVDAGARVIGVNHRDLGTFAIDMGLFEAIRPLLPAAAIAVAESGIRTTADVRRMAAAGADAILVGEQLMRQPSPGAALRELLG